MSNALTTAQSGELMNLIQNTKTIEDMKMVLAKLDGLKEALKKADFFHEQSVKFAQLEALALIRIVELGGLSKIREFDGNSSRRKVAEWLHDLNDEERNRYISMCQDGLTIQQVWKREVYASSRMEKARNVCEYKIDQFISQLDEYGWVDISGIRNHLVESCLLDMKSAEDLSQGIRRRLIKHGASGVGRNTNVYIMPGICDEDEPKRWAILNSMVSIVRDLNSLAKKSKEANVKINDSDLKKYLVEENDSLDYDLVMEYAYFFSKMGILTERG